MKKKYLIFIIINLLLLTLVMILMLAIKKNVNFKKEIEKEILKVEKIEPLEEDEIIEILYSTSEKLRVFDLDKSHIEIKTSIEKDINSYKTIAEKKEFIESVVRNYFELWKDEIIRETLLEYLDEYSIEDYNYINERTSIRKLVVFASNFEFQVFNIK